ncbi:MAG TPA: CocE/NonD family hydrolase [Nitriliruptorales bacterium]
MSPTSEPVSRFGEYQGWSQPQYDRVVRRSQYVPMSDGVELAADIYHPATEAGPADEPLPVILLVSRYWRAKLLEGGIVLGPLGHHGPDDPTIAVRTQPIGFHEPVRPLTLHRLAAHGYVVVIFENRGTGASFGRMGKDDNDDRGVRRLVSSLGGDLLDMVAWCAEAPFSNGRVGMSGGSWLGSMQLFAAANHPPALQAIFARVPSALHTHRIFQGGGVFFKAAMVTMGRTMIELAKAEDFGQVDGHQVLGPPPVDDDADGQRLLEARAGHGSDSFASYFATTVGTPAAQKLFAELGLTELVDQVDLLFDAGRLDAALRDRLELRAELLDVPTFDAPEAAGWAAELSQRITTSGIPMYLWDGWRDAHPHDRLVMFANHGAAGRLTMGPWAHGPFDPHDPREKEAENLLATESLRWYDRFLKDVDNGVDTEPPIAYAVESRGPMWLWRHAEAWPPGGAVERVLHLGPGKLVDEAGDEPGSDEFTVDYSATSGTQTTYHSVAGGGAIDLPDMGANGVKGLAYDTEPLDAPVTVVGAPVFELSASANVPDANLVVHIEEVLADGRVELVKQGFVRASHRTLRDLPYDNLGVPFPSSLESEVTGTPGLDQEVAHVVVATEQMAHTFQRGSRIRAVVTGADEGVIWTVPQDPAPTITLHRTPEHPSQLRLAVLDPAL